MSATMTPRAPRTLLTERIPGWSPTLCDPLSRAATGMPSSFVAFLAKSVTLRSVGDRRGESPEENGRASKTLPLPLFHQSREIPQEDRRIHVSRGERAIIGRECDAGHGPIAEIAENAAGCQVEQTDALSGADGEELAVRRERRTGAEELTD